MEESFAGCGGVLGARAGGAVITPGSAIAEVWPEVARRLAGCLRARAASPEDVEDAVQECALRLLAADVAFSSADDLLPWCITVGRNHLVDLARRRAPLAEAAVFDDVPSAVDVHDEVAARLSLRAVVDAWGRLSDRDRASLAEAASGTPAPPKSRKEAVRVNVARHRARQRLQLLVSASLSGLVALVRWRPRVLPVVATTAACVALVVLSQAPDQAVAVDLQPGTTAPSGQAVSVPAAPTRTRPAAASDRLRRSPATAARRTSPAAPLVLHRLPVQVRGHEDERDSSLGSVCVSGLPVVPDTCVETGPLPVSASVTAAGSRER